MSDDFDGKESAFPTHSVASADLPLDPSHLRNILHCDDGRSIDDYSDLSTIGMGGVGTVYAAQEPLLHRSVALKILRNEYRNDPAAVRDFIREARATAQIDHPNVVPVYRMGVFDEAGVYFTMKRVEGKNLREVICKLAKKDPKYLQQYSLRRLLEIFITVCNGVSFAHSKGILHRDLKPANIMLGDYGEVLVMDWGMARYRETCDQAVSGHKMNLDDEETLPPVPERKGHVGGTPAFMSPEQASGREDTVDERSDQYALGAILYSILTWQESPFPVNLPTDEVLVRVVSGRINPPRKAAPKLKIPRELEAICLKAMSRNPHERYGSIRELIEEVRNYLDLYPVGVCTSPVSRVVKLFRRRPLIPATLLGALLMLAGFFLYFYWMDSMQSSLLRELIDRDIGQARQSYQTLLQVHQALRRIAPNAERENAVRKLERAALLQELEFDNACNAAIENLSKAEKLRGARNLFLSSRIGVLLQLMLSFNLQTGNYEGLRRLLVRAHSGWGEPFRKLLGEKSDLHRMIRMLNNNEGLLWIDLRNPGMLTLYRLNGQSRELVDLRSDNAVSRLKSGLYLLISRASGRPEIQLPVRVEPAQETELKLTLPEHFPADMVYIAPGPFFGGENPTGARVPNRVLQGFLIRRTEVTFGEYLRFWKTLSEPKDRARFMGKAFLPGGGREICNLWDDSGTILPPWKAELPVVGITCEAAQAYCRWLSGQCGSICRLPDRSEIEKAARGVDRRLYIWGDAYEKDRALLVDHRDAVKYPVGAPPETFPEDVSLYGVYDLTGNVREYLRPASDSSEVCETVGGSFATGPGHASCGASGYAENGGNDVGFRYVMELGKDGSSGDD